MIERIKSYVPMERPAFDFERRFSDPTLRNSFEQSFFDFNDKLHSWATVYRYLIFMDYASDTQFMIGIGQKKVSSYWVNKVPIEFASNPPSHKVGLSYWLQNKEMTHKTKNEVLKSYDDGFVTDTIYFKREGGRYYLRLDELETEISLGEKFGEDYLKFGNLFKPFDRHNAYFSYSGQINGKDSSGVAFIQKVAINIPFVPWRWGRTFFEDGAQLDFYEPRAIVPLFKSLNFKIDDEVYKFNKNTSINMTNEGEMPRWNLSGKTSSGEEIEAEIMSYGHALQLFETKRSRFLYNEYPSNLTSLRIKKGNKTLYSLDDLGRNASNCEDAYYSRGFGKL